MGKSTINPAVVGKHSTDIAALKNDLGIVEDGDTATHTIAQGQYVIWQGALYTADAAIASGTTLAESGGNKNLTAVENGGLNALNSDVTSIKAVTTVTPNSSYIDSSQIECLKNSFMVSFTGWISVKTAIPSDNAIVFSGLPPLNSLYGNVDLKCFLINSPNKVYHLRFEGDHLETDYNSANIPTGEYRFNITYFL